MDDPNEDGPNDGMSSDARSHLEGLNACLGRMASSPDPTRPAGAPSLSQITQADLDALWRHSRGVGDAMVVMASEKVASDLVMEELKDDLAALSSFVGTGLPDEVDPSTIVDRIRQGIDMLTDPLASAFHRYLHIRRLGVVPATDPEAGTLTEEELDAWVDQSIGAHAPTRAPSL
jgi:hypothetical protein